MGYDISMMYKWLFTASLVVLVNLLIAQQTPNNSSNKENAMSKAKAYIVAFQRGEDFNPPATGVIIDGKPDLASLQVLGQALAVSEPLVRENIVTLLVDIGLRTDPLTPQGTEVLRDPKIIELLASAGLAKADIGREAAMDALRKLVTPTDLAPFKDNIVEALKESPSEEGFLLVAKAKPKKAKTLVSELAKLPAWKNIEAVRIALAALGNTKIEDEFLSALNTAKDGENLVWALGSLALIGTPRSLKAIAEHLRTPYTIHVPGAFEKSVRLNVLEALLYNFPDQPVLYPNNIIEEADYTAAEEFCIKTLGVTFSAPPPPFLTYYGYPIPLEQ